MDKGEDCVLEAHPPCTEPHTLCEGMEIHSYYYFIHSR